MEYETIEQRDELLKKLRNESWSYPELAKKFRITASRAQQIYEGKAAKEKEEYEQFELQSIKRFNGLSERGLLAEVAKLKRAGRTKEKVLLRTLCIGLLHYRFKYPLLKIADIIDRHHASVINLANKYQEFQEMYAHHFIDKS